MEAVAHVINCLEKTPIILNDLLLQIPESCYKTRRVPSKWSIHEQVCHLVEAQEILKSRFLQFELEENPLIKAYTPPVDRSDAYYLDLDMKSELENFSLLRSEMILMLKRFSKTYWDRVGSHDAFSPYSSRILLTHALNVDYAHMFSIEQLGLTKPGYENEIITIP